MDRRKRYKSNVIHWVQKREIEKTIGQSYLLHHAAKRIHMNENDTDFEIYCVLVRRIFWPTKQSTMGYRYHVDRGI